MGTLYDQSGKPVEVPDAHVTQALVSGQYLTDKPNVNVRAGGKVFSVPTANLGQFVQSAPDARVMNDDEVKAHQAEKDVAALQAQYGGLGDQAKVAAVGALGGATLGISDVALGALMSKEQKETLAKQKAANPLTNIGAGVVGAIAPTLLTGGAAAPEEAALLGGREALTLGEVGSQALEVAKGGSKVAEALGAAKGAFTAPTRALEGLSGLAERGASKLVGTEADSLAGQLAQRAIAKAAGGATTGAVATGAMDLGENAISPDHNLTGEQLLQHMGMGALFGGGLGTLSGVGGKLLEHALAPAEEGAEGGLAGAIKKRAAEIQFSATGAKTKEIRALEAHGLETHEVGRWMLDELPKFTEDGKPAYTREGIMEAAENAKTDAGGKIGGHIDVLDQVGAKPDADAIIERLRREVVAPLEKKIDPAVKGVADRLTGLIDNAEAAMKEEPTFRKLFDLRVEIDKSIAWDKKVLDRTNAMGELRNARAVVEDEIGKQGRAAEGEAWGNGYDAAKKQFRMAASVSDAADSADLRMAGNNKIGLSDTIVGAHAMTAALASGHPAAIVAALAATVGHHLLKHYGDAVGSRMLDGIVKSGALQQTIMPFAAARTAIAAQNSYTNTMVRAVSAISSGKAIAASPGRPRTTDGDFAQKSAQVKDMLKDPQAHAMAIQQHAQALGPTFPTVASSYQRTAMASSVFLGQNLPRARPIDPSMPKAGTIEPTAAEKAKFNHLYDVVTKPETALHDAAKGVVTSDTVRALSTQPATLADMQKRLRSEMALLKVPLSPAVHASVKMLLGEPVFDRPIEMAPPVSPRQQAQNAKPHRATSRPMKNDVSSTTGLVGSRIG